MCCRSDQALEEYRQAMERSDQAEGGETPPPLSSPIHLGVEDSVSDNDQGRGGLCVCVCVCVCVYIHVCVCVCLHCVHVSMFAFIHVYLCVWMCLCSCLCVHVCACMAVCLPLYNWKSTFQTKCKLWSSLCIFTCHWVRVKQWLLILLCTFFSSVHVWGRGSKMNT